MKREHLFEWFLSDLPDEELTELYWMTRLHGGLTEFSVILLDTCRREVAGRGRDMVRIIRDFDRSKLEAPRYSPPSPDSIKNTRIGLGLSYAQAASIVEITERAWRRYESGHRIMPRDKKLDFELLTNATIKEIQDV